MIRNLIINIVIGIISFGCGMFTMNKIICHELSKQFGSYNPMDKYKDNEIIMGYYERYKNKDRA